VEIREVPGSWDDGSVFVVRVGRSWNVPHCVRDREQRTFYKRSGTKSEPMDMSQIRESFVQSAGLADRILTFHRDRVDRVLGGQTTFPLEDSIGVSVVHIIPLGQFSSGGLLALADVPMLQPNGGGGGTCKPVPNFDGRIAYSGSPNVHAYIQVFRNGAVESVETDLVYENEKRAPGLRVRTIEQGVLNSIEQARTFFRSQRGVSPPCVVRLTVDGVKGALIYPPNPGYGADHVRPIEHDRLEFPDIELATLDDGVEEALHPMFDIVWQSSGWPRSLSFDKDGRYKSD
jgi:hypothetical protein